MKIIAKNFSSKKHRIEVNTQNLVVSLFIFKPVKLSDKTFWDMKKFYCRVFNEDNYTEKLSEMLKEAEQYLGIDLIQKEELKVA